MLVRPFVSRVCLFLVVSLPAPEDGQFRQKPVVVLKILKILKWQVLRTLKSVLKHWQAAQKTERESESESEIAMCDRMQMYNIREQSVMSFNIRKTTEIRSKSKSDLSYDRQPVSQSGLALGHNQGPWPIFLSSWNFRQLWVCYYMASSQTRGWSSNLLLLLDLTSAVALGSEFRGTQSHILLFQFVRLL
jgi:hypothetical protein